MYGGYVARPTRTLGDLGYRGNLKFGKHIAFRQWALLAVFLESEENVGLDWR